MTVLPSAPDEVPVGADARLPVRPDWIAQIAREVDAFVRSPSGGRGRSSTLDAFFASLPPATRDLEHWILSDLRENLTLTLGSSGREAPAERARRLLLDQYRVPWTIDALAREVGCNRTTLQEAFHALTGTTLHRFLIERRILVAARLLAHADVKVSRVSLEVGYRSHSAFARHFRAIVGVTPASYHASRRYRRAAARDEGSVE
jgi:AraC-like DNA-binding protein